ncbi:hypothetical protein [Streptomyces sp. NPDC001658]
MSTPAEDGTGTQPQGAPNVYLPRGGSTPAYEAYPDPAAAHGWQNTYDETAELPAVADAPGVLPSTVEAAPERPVAAGARSHRRHGGAETRRSRRIAVAAGAAGAVSVVALVAWFSFSGTSSDAPSGNGRPTPAAGDTVAATDPGTPADTGSADRPSDGSGAAAPSDTAPTPASPTAPTAAPATEGDAKPSSPAPTPTATSEAPTTSAPGNSDAKPGRGQGASKGPK